MLETKSLLKCVTGAVADVTTCGFEYQELDPNVVAGAVADLATLAPPFKGRRPIGFLSFHHDSFPMGPARSVSPRLIIPGPRMRVARCQCGSDIHESHGAHACFR